VYSLVTRFVQRQKLALAALSEIRPDLLGGPGKPVRPSKEDIKSTQSGYWGRDKEWRYFLHGRGCRLVHTVTGEPIEWDAPDVQRFDPHWFVNWLNWLRAQKDTSEAIRMIETEGKERNMDVQILILNVLDELGQAGVLRLHPDRTNRYELA
jgi:hypothetical protein